ncbi:MAG: radical SAM protein [Bacteroidales bacterium]|nr:radical SAM protein [Bacteroidales bacterium]
MSNIILTNNCNIKCPFCFATENNYGITKNTKEEFNIIDIWKLTPFLKDKTLKLCGGEPTLNKNIIPIIEGALINGNSVILMTNGLWPQSFKEYIGNLSDFDASKISFLFNILEDKYYTREQLENLNHVFNIINPVNSTFGITIYKKDFEYDYLLNYAEKYSVKSIRVSIAAPNITIGEYELENSYWQIANQLNDFLIAASNRNIKVYKDCNYIPPCFFSKEQLINIKFQLKGNWSFSCVSAPVDINANGEAWRCYGLFSVLRTKIGDFSTEEALKKYFNRRMRLLSINLYAYSECKECPYWQKSCLGGCYAIRIKKVLKEHPNMILFPIDDDNEILNCKPKRNESLVLRENKLNYKVYSEGKVMNQPDENMVSFLKIIDGQITIRELIDKWKENFDNYEETKNEVTKMCRKLFEKDMIDIVYDYKCEIAPLPKKL